ncbi:MAG: hypothetical protein LBS38_00190 [Endomicrobium sp.]|jgi:hypothetical protein|nr:hypothetical protein [Endomicrobium sp.]MDR2399009.1 hypothetical protein [Endomicrobium sp.]
MKKLLLSFCLLCAFVAVSFAETPIKLSLWEKIAVPDEDSVCGLEIGIGTYTSKLVGVGLNFIYSKTDDAKAWQTGIVTISKQFLGLQTGLLALSEDVTGIQFGFLNVAKSVSGLQFGLINMTENMNGIQIGLVNFIKTGKLPVMIIANAKF